MAKPLLIIILSFIISFNCFGQDIMEVKVGTNYYCNIRGNTIFFDINPTFLSVRGINFKISNEKGNMYSYYVSVPGFETPNSGVDYSKVSSVAIMEIHDDFDLDIYEENYIKSYNLLFLTTPGVALGAANREPNELYFPNIDLVTTLNGNNFNDLFQSFKQGNDYYIQIANTFDTQNTVLNFNFNSDYILSIGGINLIKNTTLSGVSKTTTLPLNITQFNSLTVTYTNFEQKVFKVYVNVFTPVKSSYKIIDYMNMGINGIGGRSAKILDNIAYFNVTTALGTTDLQLDIYQNQPKNVKYIIDDNFTIIGSGLINNFSYAGNSFIIKAIAEDNSFQTYTAQINYVKDRTLSKIPEFKNIYPYYETDPLNNIDSNDSPYDNILLANDTIYLITKPFKTNVSNSIYQLTTREFLKEDFRKIIFSSMGLIPNMSIDGIKMNITSNFGRPVTSAFDASYIRKLTVESEDGSKTKDYFIKTVFPMKNYDFDSQTIQVEVSTKFNNTKFFGTITGNNIVVNIPANISKSNLELFVYAPPGTLMYFDGKLNNSLNPWFFYDFRNFKANYNTPRLLTLWDKNGIKKEYTITVNNTLPNINYERNFNNKFGLTHLELIQSDYKSDIYNIFPIIFSTANTGKVILPFDSKPYFEGNFRNIYGNILSISGIIHGTYSELPKNINTFGSYQIKEITESGEIRDYVITIEKATTPSSNKKLEFVVENSLVIQSITGNNIKLIFKNSTDLSDLNLKIYLNKYYQEKTSQQININFHEKLWVNNELIFTKKDIYSNYYTNLDLKLNLTSPNIIKIQAQDLSIATYTVTGENYAQPKLPFNQIKSFDFGYFAFYNDNGFEIRYATVSGNNIYAKVNKNNFLLRLIRFTAKFEPGAVAFIGNSPVAERDWSYTNTLHDFSSPVLMDVYAENGDKRTYTIYVNFVDELPSLPNKIEETEIETPIEVAVYPNPNSGEKIMIQTNLEIIKTITVFDVMGNTKYAIKSSEKNISIQDVSLSKGIYFVKIATENIVVTKKIVVE